MKIERADVSAYTIPTEQPESDGTLEWRSTTIVIVEVHAAGNVGIGFTYSDISVADLIRRVLGPTVVGSDVMNTRAAWRDMRQVVRKLGRAGIASSAISAVDSALWDLKARVLNMSLGDLLGAVREGIPVYGSGGFTSYPTGQLQRQLSNWVAQGISRVKMKVGRDATHDLERVKAARQVIGTAELFVDADGAYSRKQALGFSERFAELGVTWFEEPVPSDDLDGLRLIRDGAPRGIDIAAGEYGYDSFYFQRMLKHGAVDVLQVDVTRCCGITGFLDAAAIAESHHIPISSHTASSMHIDVCCAAPSVRHAEYFYDHARIEPLFFEGALQPLHGVLRPERSRPGNGLVFKRSDAAKYAA